MLISSYDHCKNNVDEASGDGVMQIVNFHMIDKDKANLPSG